jgi:cell division protein FtsB
MSDLDDVYHDASKARMKKIDRYIAGIKKNLIPCPPQAWERDQALHAEVITLRARVAELEAQIDSMVDAAVEHAIQAEERVPYVYPGLGRPKGRKETKPRKRVAR